jgi:hypothetical protein
MPIRDVTPRFLFRGNASALAVHIRRPNDIVVPVPAASSLPLIGGESRAQGRKSQFPDIISWTSCSTRAFGDFTDPEKALAKTFGKVNDDEIPTRTEVSVRVTGLKILKRVKVELVEAVLVSEHSADGRQPSIRTVGQPRIEGLELDGRPLRVVMHDEFAKRDTFDQLARDYESDDAFHGRYHHCFFNAGPAEGGGGRKLPHSDDVVYCTIVDGIKWVNEADERDPVAEIQGNQIYLPGYGNIYLGELFISESERRLTMMRFEFGSPDGGSGSVGGVESNGTIWP